MKENEINTLFKTELIRLNEKFTSQEDFFKKISKWLTEKGYVKDTFYQAIYHREQESPTGLHTPTFDVAIPHTDPEHVREAFIAVIRPEQSISFREMGNLQGATEPQLLFVIGFKESEDQLSILQNLMKMFQNQKIMDFYLHSNDTEEIYTTINEYLRTAAYKA